MKTSLLGELLVPQSETHRSIGPGLLESVYQQCLAQELVLRRIPFEREVPIGISCKGMSIDHAFRADFLIDNRLIIELKAMNHIDANHKAQLLTYIKWLRCKLGLLIKGIMGLSEPPRFSGHF